MSVLAKLAVYLIGAVTLLFAFAPPQEHLKLTGAARKETAHMTATSSIAAENIAVTGAEKVAEKPESPKEIVIPKPRQTLRATPPDILSVNPLLNPPPKEGGGTEEKKLPSVKPASQMSWSEINKRTRAALVNIVCTTIRSGSFEPVSGSGVIIDPRGLILTNAHIAEYFLLKDYLVPDFVQCVIRTGEPARNRYKARLLYLSPLWLQANYTKIRLAEPTGTGEHDFALLLIAESVNQEASPLPETYPFLPLDFTNETVRAQSQVLVAGYPAGFLSGINIQKEFYPSSSIVTTGPVFTFREKTADVFSIGGSPLAQEGSSGGAVVSAGGTLIGLVATATAAEHTGERDLRAITPSHIAASFRADTGNDLMALIASDLAATAENFSRNVAPALTKLLESALQKK